LKAVQNNCTVDIKIEDMGEQKRKRKRKEKRVTNTTNTVG
jgi:hypothetical protein